MLPKRAEGHLAAAWIASFKSRACIRKKPPRDSLVSANGPPDDQAGSLRFGRVFSMESMLSPPAPAAEK